METVEQYCLLKHHDNDTCDRIIGQCSNDRIWQARNVGSCYNIGFMSTFYKGLLANDFSLDISVINLFYIWNKNFKSDNSMTYNQ